MDPTLNEDIQSNLGGARMRYLYLYCISRPTHPGTTFRFWHSSELNPDGGGKSGEGRGGVKLREGSQTPMVVGESGGNLPRAAGDETLSKEQRRFLVGLPNTDRRQKRTQKGKLQKSKLS